MTFSSSSTQLFIVPEAKRAANSIDILEYISNGLLQRYPRLYAKDISRANIIYYVRSRAFGGQRDRTRESNFSPFSFVYLAPPSASFRIHPSPSAMRSPERKTHFLGTETTRLRCETCNTVSSRKDSPFTKRQETLRRTELSSPRRT